MAAKLLAKMVYEESGIQMKVDRVAIRFPNAIELEGLCIYDHLGDTLISCGQLRTAFLAANGSFSNIKLGATRLNKPNFYLHSAEGDSLSNLDHILRKLDSGSQSENEFRLTFSDIKFSKGRFTLWMEGDPIDSGINFDSLVVRNIEADVRKFDLRGDSLFLGIQHLSGEEGQGLTLQEYHGDFAYSSHSLNFLDFQLRTADSRVDGSFTMTYNYVADLADFSNKVRLDADLKPSLLVLDDISTLVPAFKNIKNDFFIRGSFTGKIAELQGNDVVLEWGNSSFFRGNMYCYGLPNIQNTYIDFDVDYLRTNYQDLILLDILEKENGSFIPPEFKHLGQLDFKGSFTGYLNDFVAYGDLNTEVGSLSSDISVYSKADTLRYSGDIKSKQFNLGAYFKNPQLGALSASINVNGQGSNLDRLKAKVDGKIESFEFSGYKYSDIRLDGVFNKRTFTGFCESRDPNFNFNFNGLVNFQNQVPKYDFSADLFGIDLSALKLLEDSLNAGLSGRISLQGEGIAFANFKGLAQANNLSFCISNEEYYLGDIRAETFEEKTKGIRLNSQLGNAVVRGDLYPNYLIDDLKRALSEISSVYFATATSDRKNEQQNFNFEIELTNAEILSGILAKDFDFSGGLSLNGYFKSASNELGFNGNCDALRIGSNNIEQLIIEGSKSGSVTNFWLHSEFLDLGAFKPGKLDFTLKGVSDNFQTALTWNNPRVTDGNMNALVEILGQSKGRVDWLPSTATFAEEKWDLKEGAQSSWDSTGFTFSNIEFNNQFQELSFAGKIGRSFESVDVELFTKNFALSNLEFLTGGKPEITGVANGTAQFIRTQDSVLLASNLDIRNLKLNGKQVGNVVLQSNQQQASKRVGFSGTIVQDNQIGKARFYGTYATATDEPLQVNVDFTKFDLAFLDGQFSEDVTKIQGKAFGSIAISGSIDSPKMRGKIKIEDAYFFIPFLQSGFAFNDEIIVRPDYIGINYIDLKDDLGRTAKLTGTVLHDDFSNWNYDFFAEFTNNRVLNTTKFDNSTFYGTLYASGTLDIAGYAANTRIEVNAKPEKGTQINIPLGGIEELEDLDYVQFVSNESEKEEETTVDLSGLDLSLEFDVNPNAVIQLIFDEAVGDIIRTTGSGLIKMNIDARENFEMFGSYAVDYLFTLENLVNKRFDIQQGSTINWFGDPYEALLDINAKYEVRAPLYDILLTADERFKRREPVIVQMHLAERLVNPEIKFDIALPNADDFVRGQVKSVVSTEQEMNRQVFALLVLNRFVPPLNAGPTQESRSAVSSLGSSGSELLSNQVSNMVSQISSDFNLGFNYRSGDQLTRSEVAVGLSTQIFNERVSIFSNFGVTDRSSSNPNGLVSDFTVEYALTKDGRVRLRAFNETADNIYTGSNLSPFIQGVGLSYSTQFDNLAELWKRFKSRITRKEEKEEAVN
ncbi:MAG: translocation/assembly module TamB domain-containing protein [Luteibaculum sp.]